ncbi:MAG: GspE/PulE family protein [Patescibacteria group bacterium]
MSKKPEIKIENALEEFFDRVFTTAVAYRASDIHIEPENNLLRVRFRVDGVLREIEQHPISILESLVSRIKVLSEMDISEHRKPQDGRLEVSIEKKKLDVRVSTMPTIHGENVAMRILDRSSDLLNLEVIGFSDKDLAQYQELITRPYGIVFITGPNGSGKTTAIYSSLNKINAIEKSIATLEDPVEYQLPLIRQTQIEPGAGLTFATGLRALLRQDPDVILVGEIRDQTTAEIAVRSALTGHLVFTSLHTNDSVGAIARLQDMGVEPVLIASATVGIIATRLVRTVCPHCHKKYKADIGLAKELGIEMNATLVKATGCERCGNTGYYGRTGIFELLVPDDEFRSAFLAKQSFDELRRMAKKKGMSSLRQSGIAKIVAGVTTVEEVFRVTKAV